MVSVGRAVGVCGNHFTHGDGKLDLPVPSEIVIPPAAFLAMEGKLNTFGVDSGGYIRLMARATGTYWARCAWTCLHRSVGALFSAQRA